MNFKINRRGLGIFLYNNLFWIIIIGYILTLICGALSVVGLMSLLLIVCYITNFKMKKVHIDITTLYFIYLMGTGIIYSTNGLPIILYVNGIAYILFPILIYFIRSHSEILTMRHYIEAIFFSLLVALFLYIWEPSFYALYLYNRGLIGGPLVGWIRGSNLQGVYGITPLSSFCGVCFIYYWWRYAYKDKNSLIKSIICFMMLIYSRRRGPIISVLFVFILENIILYRRGKSSVKRTLVLCICTLATVFFSLVYRDNFIMLYQRLTNIDIALAERNMGWTEVVANLNKNFLFGKGIGSSGHVAIQTGFVGVADGQYAFMIAEEGIVGLLLFTMVNIKALLVYISIPKKNRDVVSMLVTIAFLLQGIGSNILEFPIIGIFYWYCLASMQRKIEIDEIEHMLSNNSYQYNAKRIGVI